MSDRPKTILCVDDDIDILDTFRTVLEASGYTVKTAQTAEAGVRQYKTCKPDLVIVDLMMEEVDSGVQLVRELRALSNRSPIYMLTSVGDMMAGTIDVAELGLAGIFQKPLSNQLLLTTISAKLKG